MKLQTIVAAIASLAALAGTAGSATPAGAAIHLIPGRGHQVTFTVEGSHVGNMYPGITKPMPLRVRNPYSFDLKVTHLGGVVVHSSKRACPPLPRNLKAERYEGQLPFTVKAKQNKSIGSIPIRMPASVTNECAGVTFTIRLYGTATKVQK
jgi:hypothetical protein